MKKKRINSALITTQTVMPVLPTLTTGNDSTRSIGSRRPIMFSSRAAAAPPWRTSGRSARVDQNRADSSPAVIFSAQRFRPMRSVW